MVSWFVRVDPFLQGFKRALRSKTAWFDGSIVFLTLLFSYVAHGLDGILPAGVDAASIITSARLLRLLSLLRVLYNSYLMSKEEDEELESDDSKSMEEVGVIAVFFFFFFFIFSSVFGKKKTLRGLVCHSPLLAAHDVLYELSPQCIEL